MSSPFFLSVPLGSVNTLPAEQRQEYFLAVARMPGRLSQLLSSERTGAYLRGLAKQFSLEDSMIGILALVTLRTAIGEVRLDGLSDEIKRQLGVDTATAQAIATDIEKELFNPVMADYTKYLAQKGGNKDDLAIDEGQNMPNTLDLRDDKPFRR